MIWNRILVGDVREQLKKIPRNSIHCCVTSPPYWNQRDYEIKGQLGLEKTVGEFTRNLVEVFSEVDRVLRDDGVLFVNIGDTYATAEIAKNEEGFGVGSGIKVKDLVGVPWRFALEMQKAGWYLRQDCIWLKPNSTPTSQLDRCTKNHEYIFMFTKRPHYYFDIYAILEPSLPQSIARSKYDFGGSKAVDLREADKKGMGCRTRIIGKWDMPDERFPRSVWSIPCKGIKEKHFAVFPAKLPSKCILAGTSERGACPHCGAPWQRKVKKIRIATRPGADTKTTGVKAEVKGNRDPERHVVKIKTIGWEPTCDCKNNKPVPCKVLDCFMGSGTTARAAKRLHRDWIGIEINKKYARSAMKRIEKLQTGLLPIAMKRD